MNERQFLSILFMTFNMHDKDEILTDVGSIEYGHL